MHILLAICYGRLPSELIMCASMQTRCVHTHTHTLKDPNPHIGHLRVVSRQPETTLPKLGDCFCSDTEIGIEFDGTFQQISVVHIVTLSNVLEWNGLLGKHRN